MMKKSTLSVLIALSLTGCLRPDTIKTQFNAYLPDTKPLDSQCYPEGLCIVYSDAGDLYIESGRPTFLGLSCNTQLQCQEFYPDFPAKMHNNLEIHYITGDSQ